VPSINKSSVRNEVSRLKAEFDSLCAEGKVTGEIKVLMILELMLSIFLERSTKKDSNNSSKPPSQTEKDDESSLTQQGSNGKGKKENNTLASNTRIKENVTLSEARACDICGEDTDTPCLHQPCTALERVQL